MEKRVPYRTEGSEWYAVGKDEIKLIFQKRNDTLKKIL